MKVFICLSILALAGFAQCKSPFFSKESEDVDSSEHGGPPGRRGTTCDCGWSNKNGLRVVGGRQTKVNEFPFVVAILDLLNHFAFCGGSIITPNHVLTAAHCTDDYINPTKEAYGRPLIISAGDHDLRQGVPDVPAQMIRVVAISQHEQYSERTFANDIAILHLERPIRFSQSVGPVCMFRTQTILEKQSVKVIGWGRVGHNAPASPVLKTVDLRIVPQRQCFAKYPNLSYPSRKQVCTHSQYQGACMGDSGGPLVWVDPDTNRYTLAGVVSFGRICASEDPSVYTDPAAYLDWIKSKIAASAPQPMCYKA